MFRAPIRALGDDYALALSPDERAVVRRLARELAELVEAGHPAVGRLFPAAFRDDEAAAAEFDRLVREGLVAGRLRALATVDRSADAERLTHEEVEAWCGALNDIRLTLAERLDVTDDLYERGIDPDDPRAPDLALYGWLTWLQGMIVEALSARLPGQHA